MQQYLDLLDKIKKEGVQKEPARENMPTTKSIFGHQMRFNLQDGFPIITTKKISFKNILGELLWFLKADSNIKYLIDNNINIWNEDAYNYYVKKIKDTDHNHLYIPCNTEENVRNSANPDSYSLFTFEEFVNIIKNTSLSVLKYYYSTHDYKLGDTGSSYPILWNNWNSDSNDIGINQIENVINNIIKNPFSRRHIVTAWNPDVVENNLSALPACHALFQFNCRPATHSERVIYAYNKKEKDLREVPEYVLDCHLYQRSADVFLGVPYNISSYALLTHIIAKKCNMIAGEFIHSFGDVHIYSNHENQVDEQLTRKPFVSPILNISNRVKDIDLKDIEMTDFTLIGYDYHEAINAKLSTGLR